MKVLVTGGAGYIGSITVERLLQRGDEVCIIDNLVTGHRGSVPEGVAYHSADLIDTDAITEILHQQRVEAVVHCAASTQVGESVEDPAKYMNNNVGGTLSLLDAMRAVGVGRIVFSSTAAVYGEPESLPLREDHPTRPTNPYGMTKRVMEQTMEAYANAYGLQYAIFRYFNAAGAIEGKGEHHEPETHLIPIVLQVALGKRAQISIFGNDYDTHDGTCVRDYLHVWDIAQAHMLALDHLAAGGDSKICNLGNGKGFSVREVIETCREVTGREIKAVEQERRPGDSSLLIADSTKAHDELGWAPEKPTLREIVADAWAWHSAHPAGYGIPEPSLESLD